MKAFVPLLVFMICLIGICAMFVGREIGIWMTQKEAVEHHKAEWFTNEAGEQVYRWLP